MKFFLKAGFVLMNSLLFIIKSPAQEISHNVRIGFGFLIGKQNIFPFNDLNYSHSQKGYRLQFNYLLKNGRFSYELQVEPSFYTAQHELLNPYYIQPSDGGNYMLQREYYSQPRTVNDYALNIGLVTRYNFNTALSAYFLFSTGPTWLDAASEREARGFAFSNVISIGAALNAGRFRIEFGPGIRHVSNANTHFPNGGYNSSTLDAGITYSFHSTFSKKTNRGLT